MMRTIPAMVLAALLAVPAHGGDEVSPYVIDKKTFAKQVHKVALAPVDVPPGLAVPDEILTAIDAEIQARLVKEKLEVIPSAVLRDIRVAMTEQVGGLTTATGEYDVARAQAVRDHSFREMQFRHAYDAVVVARIVQVAAPWKNDRAQWDGTKQTIQHKGGGRYAGKLPALSLLVVFIDRSGRPLYQAYGGLEVLVRRDKQRLVPLQRVDLWKDPKRANKAVSIALDAL